jgi:hypothetical protein
VLWIGFAALDAHRTVALHRGPRGVRAFFLDERAIEVELADGTFRSGEVRDGSFVAPWLTIVRWRPLGTRCDRSIVVLPDMLPRDDFRALRVLLRMGKNPRQ